MTPPRPTTTELYRPLSTDPLAKRLPGDTGPVDELWDYPPIPNITDSCFQTVALVPCPVRHLHEPRQAWFGRFGCCTSLLYRPVEGDRRAPAFRCGPTPLIITSLDNQTAISSTRPTD